MSNYLRQYQPGSWYFFTVVTYGRRPVFADSGNRVRLKRAMRAVMTKRPFTIDAMVVLPDHLHCLWRLPEDDADFFSRWRIIKRYFSVGMDTQINSRREKKVWQRRYWEHLIQDELDWCRHMDYIHYNPVKHGYVRSPGEWPYSSFHRAVRQGYYTADWGRSEPEEIVDMALE